MGKIIKIDNHEITEILKSTTRQYFVGNLSKPQKLSFIKDDRLEIGLSSYETSQSETVHVHDVATEYQYMISGWTEYLDINTNEVTEFRQGDFYAILPGTTYAQRVKAGTKILFIKTPSLNDKVLVEPDDAIAKWLSTKMRSVRTDYYYCDSAPKANSIRPAAAVAIIHDEKILMLKRADNHKWTMPGGTLDFGESLTECAIREVIEETGLLVEITDVIGTYTDPHIRVAYSDGEVRQEFTIVYAGKCTSESVVLDEESTAFRWVSICDIEALELASSQKKRLMDVIEYHKTGKKSLC